jgi:hypothetical protein
MNTITMSFVTLQFAEREFSIPYEVLGRFSLLFIDLFEHYGDEKSMKFPMIEPYAQMADAYQYIHEWFRWKVGRYVFESPDEFFDKFFGDISEELFAQVLRLMGFLMLTGKQDNMYIELWNYLFRRAIYTPTEMITKNIQLATRTLNNAPKKEH